jgi:hypothetical protein
MLTRGSAQPARLKCPEAFFFIQMQHPLVDIQKFVIEIPATLPPISRPGAAAASISI